MRRTTTFSSERAIDAPAESDERRLSVARRHVGQRSIWTVDALVASEFFVLSEEAMAHDQRHDEESAPSCLVKQRWQFVVDNEV